MRVELGARAYDILIGRGPHRGSRRARSPRCCPAARRDRHRRERGARASSGASHSSLRTAGIDSTEIVVPPGEASKSFERLQAVVEACSESRLERNDVVVALGGGVVGDLAGFAAAIMRRGMRFVQMPTTLLAQVDSSVGGKTGINTRRGKNLVGVFHQPALVLADTLTLDTLPPREFHAGYAEVAKVGLIGDAQILRLARRRTGGRCSPAARRASGAIAESVRFKARDRRRRRARDRRARAPQSRPHLRPCARGRHRLHRDRLVHGEAVAIGMVLAHDFSVAEGLAPAGRREPRARASEGRRPAGRASATFPARRSPPTS